MSISQRQLRLFLAFAESGRVGEAARRCHVTQPTASMQLQAIAETVGLPLYESVGRRLCLTEAGEHLATTARAIAREWEAFDQAIAGLKGLEHGTLRVSVVSTAKYFVPRLLGRFCHAHPGIDISLQVLNRDGVIERLRANRDDLYVMSQPPADIALEDRVLMPNPLVVIAPAAHPLAARKRLRLSDLAGERLLLREPGSGTRLAIDAHFARHAFIPAQRIELGSNEAIREAVAGGLGIAVLSRHALRREKRPGDVVELPVSGFPLPAQWHLVWHQGKRLSPIAEVFAQHLQATAAR